jgi:GNAT superfamily N-acetyltransferase
MITVRVVESSADLEAFVDLPYRLSEDVPNWVPPFRRDVFTQLDREQNPFFEHGEAEYFLAEREGKVVGRVAAIVNTLHNEVHGDRIGFFGFFECVADAEAAQALLSASAEWLAERGMTKMRGPMSFSVNDECGVLIEGFERPPYLMMPYNQHYYDRLLKGVGMSAAKDLLAYRGGHQKHAVPRPERLERAANVLERRLGITLRAADMSDFVGEVQKVREIFNASWSDNWGFVPMTESEMAHGAGEFRPIVIPELLPFAMKDGKEIAFALAVPNVNEVLIKNRSGAMFPTAPKLVWSLKRRKIRSARIFLLGVLPEFRGKGIDAMLYQWIWAKAAEHKIYAGEAGWILEENAAMSAGLVKMGFEPVKRYRIYERPI